VKRSFVGEECVEESEGSLIGTMKDEMKRIWRKKGGRTPIYKI